MKKILRFLTALSLAVCMLLLPVSALSVEEARQLLDEYYVDDLPDAAWQAQTLDELFAAIGDPYTVYMSKEDYNQFISSMNDSSLVGIGVSVQNSEQGVLIASVLPDSPALEAGLEAGDIIQTVDGVPIHTTEEGLATITGEEGTSVHLLILRKDGSVLELDLVRRTVVIPTTLQYALSEDGNAGLIVCDSFGDNTAAHLRDALMEDDDKVCAWVIDLRANPGGTSQAAAGAAGWFVGGAVMAYFRDGEGGYFYTYTMPFTPVLTDKPAIILTSPYSASGSELFSAAMRDHGTGIAVGQRTFGKGVAQITLTDSSYPDLFDGDALKVTVYRFYSPIGTTNDQLGVLPTLMVSMENTVEISLLLTCPVPERPEHHLKVELAGHTFAVDLDRAMEEEYVGPFSELLEALPPSAKLSRGSSGQWKDTTPAQVAAELKLSYTPRTFTDTAGTKYETAIDTLAVYRLLSGWEDGGFHPEAGITRGEMCAMLANLLGLELPPADSTPFSDVPAHKWYAPAVNAMYQRGLVDGSDGLFRPEEAITQEEVVGIVSNLAQWLNMDALEGFKEEPDEETLQPFSAYSDGAKKSAWLLTEMELDLSGLTPQDTATRGMAIDLVYQLMNTTNVLWH